MTDTLIKLTGLHENTSAKTGRRYFTGYLGGAKLVLLEDTKAEPGKPTWNLFVAERPERRDRPKAADVKPDPGRLPLDASPTTSRRRDVGRKPARPDADDEVPFNDGIPF